MKQRIQKLKIFTRQIVAEMRKVIWPTRGELRSSTATVIVFVIMVALFVVGIDYLAGQGIIKLYS